ERLRYALYAVATLTAACFLLGCAPIRLAGTNDAVLEYTLHPHSGGGDPGSSGALAANVKVRLVMAQVMADVDAPEAGRVRVVVDADAAGAVDEPLWWRG